MISKYKNIIIIAAIIGIALIAYSFLRPDPTAESLLETTQRQSSAQVLGDEITSAINQINSLKLERGVLDDPVVKNLIDHSKPIIPEPIGRENPFAPITSDGSDTPATTTSATSSTVKATTTAPAQPRGTSTTPGTPVR